MSQAVAESPLEHIPPPRVVANRIGAALRELTLLRRLLRLSEATYAEATDTDQPETREHGPRRETVSAA